MRNIKYKNGDVIGDYGCVFISGVAPYVYGSTNKKKRKARFKCHCGNEFETLISQVKNNRVKSCGCALSEAKTIKYAPGQKIGECTYLHDVSPKFSTTNRRYRMCMFKCGFCGTHFKASVVDVKSGHTRSCGCFLREVKPSRRTHGLNKTPTHITWGHIKARCFNPNSLSYENYGARGITMCDEWRNSFKVFHDYVIKLDNYGEPGRTLDRYPDNDGNYEPGNVRWATKKEQANNRRKRRYYKKPTE